MPDESVRPFRDEFPESAEGAREFLRAACAFPDLRDEVAAELRRLGYTVTPPDEGWRDLPGFWSRWWRR